MSASAQRGGRYRAKAARRPFLFWWQAFFLFGVVVLLWSQLPVTAVLFEPRSVPPLHEPRAAYVLLDGKYAAQAFKKSLTAWTLGGAGGGQALGLELGGIDLGAAHPEPEYLKQGMRYPGEWQPSAVKPLPLRLPDVRPSVVASWPSASPAREAPPGVRLAVSRALEAAAFACPVEEDPPPERSGHCRFYVETGADGAVEHVLLLSARTLGASVFERTMLRGRATGAARGFVDVDWSFPK